MYIARAPAAAEAGSCSIRTVIYYLLKLFSKRVLNATVFWPELETPCVRKLYASCP